MTFSLLHTGKQTASGPDKSGNDNTKVINNLDLSVRTPLYDGQFPKSVVQYCRLESSRIPLLSIGKPEV